MILLSKIALCIACVILLDDHMQYIVDDCLCKLNLKSRAIFQNAFKRVLKTYNKLNPTKYYCIDSSYVKNQYRRSGLGKNHTDRGRKAIKLSLIVDQNGVSYGMRCDPGNRPDVTLGRMWSSFNIEKEYKERI